MSNATIPLLVLRDASVIGTLTLSTLPSGPLTSYNVIDFGADPTGVADSTMAIQAAFAALPVNGGALLFPSGTYVVSHINFDGKGVTLRGLGWGAQISCSGHANGAIYKTAHNADQRRKLIVEDIQFIGVAPAIKLAMVPVGYMYDEYCFTRVTFNMDDTDYAVSIVGACEGKLSACTWYGAGGGGIYFQSSISPWVIDCQFIGTSSEGKAIFYDGVEDGYSCGLAIRDCEIMGWDIGVECRYHDWLSISGSTIDNNTNGAIVVVSANGATIKGNLLGSASATAAVIMKKGVLVGKVPGYCNNIHIEGNWFVGVATTDYDNILITDMDATQVHILNNHLLFYTRHGVNFTAFASGGIVEIAGNVFSPRLGYGSVCPIKNSGTQGDSGVVIRNNKFEATTTFASSGLVFAQLWDNAGFGTNNRGVYYTSGLGPQFAINHELSTTPDYVQVSVLAATEQPLWVYGVSATQIGVETGVVSGSIGVCWEARKLRGV